MHLMSLAAFLEMFPFEAKSPLSIDWNYGYSPSVAPASDNRGLWVMGYGLWVMGYGLWVMGSGFWVLGSGFWVLGSGFWVLNDK
jgi:hypothetical protein